FRRDTLAARDSGAEPVGMVALHRSCRVGRIRVFIMFWPVLNPLPETPRLKPALAMGYLFLMTIIPTIPASFLTFTNTFLYSDAYPPGPRLWGLDAVTD
ncbi:MAG: cytochrome c oxidase assembly protein, partial [Acidimicrobiia bacterium]